MITGARTVKSMTTAPRLNRAALGVKIFLNQWFFFHILCESSIKLLRMDIFSIFLSFVLNPGCLLQVWVLWSRGGILRPGSCQWPPASETIQTIESCKEQIVTHLNQFWMCKATNLSEKPLKTTFQERKMYRIIHKSGSPTLLSTLIMYITTASKGIGEPDQQGTRLIAKHTTTYYQRFIHFIG